MTDKKNSIQIEADQDDNVLIGMILSCENNGRQIDKPEDPVLCKRVRKVVHSILAGRLIEARNKSKFQSNDLINKAMHEEYLKRGREGKAWSYTNSVTARTGYFPDGEEVGMFAKLLSWDENELSIHLNVIPWIMADQRKRREENKRRQETKRRKTSINTLKKSITGYEATDHKKDRNFDGPGEMPNDTTISREMPRREFSVRKAPQRQPIAVTKPVAQIESSGDIKISHDDGKIIVSGKIWCNRKAASKLRLIVQMKLIQQLGTDELCYELYGPVHGYQLYNLVHVLYGAPKVLTVEGV